MSKTKSTVSPGQPESVKLALLAARARGLAAQTNGATLVAEVAPIRRDILTDPMQVGRAFSKLLDDLNVAQCTLACASVALGQAQDILITADEREVRECRDLGAKALTVIYRCVAELDQLHTAFDCWHVDQAHEVTP
jgi:hypothetical protein